MLDRIDLRGPTADPRRALAAARLDDPELVGAVSAIVADVRERGDAALRDLTARFDGCTLDDLEVAPGEIAAALDGLDPDLRLALEFARDQVLAWHEAQRDREPKHERSGIRITERIVPVDRAGCYVPGGRATYPSTVLMTAIPARVAGVPEVVLCVPPGPDGTVPAVTLAAAALAGVDTVYRVGGAQAIAALAFGTETIAPADVIVGPGNAYVTEAKRQVVGLVGIDALAGPSEVAVIADDSAVPEWVAADLLAQAEHGPGGVATLITWSEPLADAVDAALVRMVRTLPRHADAEATLRDGGRLVLVDDARAAIDVSNLLAPEHLELQCEPADVLVPLVRSAGAVFVGAYAPAAVGDYVAGVNHVLPTGRTARFASALRVSTFHKHIHVVHVDADALGRVAPFVGALARAEGLDAHARSVSIRESRP
ncbi:MAG TPA: histidinol dehydrogenase [Acidimicrobiia bacterium]|nr:histidinol dehydrogenase [Acidimicrobiia bacterium]